MAEQKSKSQVLQDYMALKLNLLGEVRKTPRGKAALAQLRQGLGKKPGEVPETWGLLLEGMPAVLQGNKDIPSPAENAVFTALTLYGSHMQSADSNMHVRQEEWYSLGTSLRKLVKESEDEQRIVRRLKAAAGTKSLTELSVHLRSLISLLRAESIPLDYVELARNLYYFQFPKYRSDVCLGWARAFYRSPETGNANAEKDH